MSRIESILMIASEAREFRGILRNCVNAVRLDWPVDFAWCLAEEWDRRRHREGHRLIYHHVPD